MKFTSGSSSLELMFPSFEGLQCTNMNAVISKRILKVKKNNVKVSNCHAKKLFISSHLMPGHLEGLYTGKKQLEDAGQKLEFVRTLLIDNYDSYTYNIYQELSVINGLPPVVVQNDDLGWKEVCHYLYEENAFDNIVISPGPGTPACPADIGICLQLLLECRDIPILGVCLGHQALGYVHGARVVHASEPIHGRLSEIEHNGCRLFHKIPSGKNSGFKVVRYHSLVVDAESLPNELIPIAWTSSSDTLSYLETQKPDIVLEAFESQTGQKSSDSFSSKLKNGTSWPSRHTECMGSRKVLMGIMHSTRPHYGLQFHPESIGTCYGRQIFKNFREMTQDYWLTSRSSVVSERKARHAGLPFRGIPINKQLVNDVDARKCFGMSNLLNLSLPSSGFKFLKLKWRKFDHLASEVGGVRNIFCELFGDHKAENTFWLDSSSTEKRARFSFMGGKGGSLWKHVTFKLSHERRGGNLSIEDGQGCIRSKFLEDGFLDFLSKGRVFCQLIFFIAQRSTKSPPFSSELGMDPNQELLSLRYEEKDYEGLPFDFHGGYVGYIGYNLKVECGMASNHHKSSTPDACLFFADNLIVIDHHYDDVYIMSLQEGQTVTTLWLDDTEQKLLGLKASAAKKFKVEHPQPVTDSPSEAGFSAEKSREQYMKDVEKCLKLIKDGESYELCLTTQMRKRIGQIDYLRLYLNLREKNPAPYAAWLNFSKENLCICCSSPERFLQLDRNGILEAKPIKGTIARGLTEEEDENLKLRLQYSEKDQAENLMIVDLLRNDLGRVCEPGSIHVPHLMDVESYATVHTMVSTIRGKKQSKMSPVDCVRAAFPGGSMTGAPKLRSMELLDSIENSSRGIYSGSIGFFSYNQTFDLNIVIRTIVIHEGEASVGGGGAIVALSNPEGEYEEMILKTRAPINTILEFEKESISN